MGAELSLDLKSTKRMVVGESRGEHKTASGCGEQSAEIWATRAGVEYVKPTIDATPLLGTPDTEAQPLLRGERVQLRAKALEHAWRLRDAVWRHTNPRERLRPAWTWEVIESGLDSAVIEHSSTIQRWEDDDPYTLQVRCPTWALELIGGGGTGAFDYASAPETDEEFRLRRVRSLRAKRATKL